MTDSTVPPHVYDYGEGGAIPVPAVLTDDECRWVRNHLSAARASLKQAQHFGGQLPALESHLGWLIEMVAHQIETLRHVEG